MKTTDIQIECHRLSQRFKALGINQEKLANALGTNQSQISRILSGKCKRPSKVFLRLCNYANSLPATSNTNPISNSVILDAIAFIWDGTDEHAEHIAHVLRNLKPLSDYIGRR